jgi:mono/diheme cytochrome c family protein
MKRAKFLMALLCLLTLVVSAEQGDSAASRKDSVELERWIRATSGDSKAASNPMSETRLLASLGESERQGAFLFRQRCYTCHYSALSPLSYGPSLSRRNVDGREALARRTIADGTDRMPAFRYGLTPVQIDMIVAYLKKVAAP